MRAFVVSVFRDATERSLVSRVRRSRKAFIGRDECGADVLCQDNIEGVGDGEV
jgi:hypothetical protein